MKIEYIHNVFVNVYLIIYTCHKLAYIFSNTTVYTLENVVALHKQRERPIQER